jgi:DNA modification methylase
MTDDVQVIHGDCVDAMDDLPEHSVDAIVTDPPYGLEFMGREWDRLDGGLPQEAQWKGRRGQGGASVRDDDSRPASRHGVAYGVQRHAFNRCQACGRREFSGTPCTCDEPDWVVEHNQGPPTAAVRMQRWHERWARAAYRVLKPGGWLLAFGGTRTYHRLACGVEDAGFDIRDELAWLYGQGFPKSLDVSRAIDDHLWRLWLAAHPDAAAQLDAIDDPEARGEAEDELRSQHGFARQIVATQRRRDIRNGPGRGRGYGIQSAQRDEPEYFDHEVTAPATDQAAEWTGWGTGLKPGHEPIVVARKPLLRTVAATVLEHGTGALNIDRCRIPHASDADRESSEAHNRHAQWGTPPGQNNVYGDYSQTPMRDYDGSKGRWPANVLLDEAAAAMLDGHSGEVGGGYGISGGDPDGRGIYGKGFPRGDLRTVGYGDSGGASRFFYTAKASAADRGPGNDHPTVKPVDLMRWLVRLVTADGGTVLDPFAGSGTTGVAAVIEGRQAILVEREPCGACRDSCPDYIRLINERLGRPIQPVLL